MPLPNTPVTRTVYLRVNAGQTGLPVGTYQSVFSGVNARVAYSQTVLGLLPSCAAMGAANAVDLTFTVQAENTPACSVSAPTLSFGTHGVLAANVDATTDVSVTCAAGLAYTVGLNGGTAGATDPTQRKMAFASQEVVYGLYRDAGRSLPWGDTIGTNTVGGTGNGSAQPITVYGRVGPQVTPSPGTYSDTIIITVTY